MTILELYQKIYDSLIEKRRREPLTKNKKDPNYIYCETHHILPKCLGGSNDKENLINLTAREHFIAHKLLLKIYEKLNDKNAYMRMGMALGRLITGNKAFINNVSISSREYERIKELWLNSSRMWRSIPENKEKMKYERTKEIREKLSKSQKIRFQNMSEEEKQKNHEAIIIGHKNMSKELKQKISKNMSKFQKERWKNMDESEKQRLGNIFSENQRNFSEEKKKEITNKKRKTLKKNNMYEYRSKWSANHKWVKNPLTHESKYIEKEEVDKYISNGWIPGFYKGKHKYPRNVTTIWICNDDIKESKRWKKDQTIPNGWRKGRIYNWKKK